MYQYPILFIAHICFWLIYATFEHISHLLYGQNHWQGSLLASIVVMVATGFLAMIYERIREKPILFRMLSVLLIGVLVILVWHNITRVLHHHISIDELFQAPLLEWFEGSSYRILLILTWAGLLASAFNYLEKKAHQVEMLLVKSTAKEAQLQQLMYQLNPHFLFNVLNSVDVAILEKDNDAAHQMVIKLSRLLRTTLEHKFHSKIQLKQELELLEHFIEIEQQRFRQKIQFNYDIQPDALSAYLPPLILQPLMENAIKHSWNLGVDCKINLNAVIQEKQLCLSISNPVNEGSKAQPKGTNTGLENVTSRLGLLYGDDAKLHTMMNSDQFEVTVLIPLELAA
ncbi:sensor histidine kinase [Colwelliaceae bacterium 6471]